MDRAVEINGFSDSSYVFLMLNNFCITEDLSLKLFHDSRHAESLWTVMLVPALETNPSESIVSGQPFALTLDLPP